MFWLADPEENRNGLCAEFTLHNPTAEPESVTALRQIQLHQHQLEGVRVKTVADDKAYPRKDFVVECRKQSIAPHVAGGDGVKAPGLDGHTTRQESYRLSQKIRKRVEEVFGRIQTVDRVRRSRNRGKQRTRAWG